MLGISPRKALILDCKVLLFYSSLAASISWRRYLQVAEIVGRCTPGYEEMALAVHIIAMK